MIQAGKNITQTDDPLVKIQVEHLYHSVRTPKPEIESQIRQLRLVKTLDTKRYSQLKRNLPYVVCGIFNPPVRRTENFAWITHFILDFDHLSEKGLTLESLKLKLAADARVVMLFVSPGNDGLKAMFRLSEKCYDSGKYSLFYKVFSRRFSQQYQLDQVIDQRTSDVARACFVSSDPDIFFNPQAEQIRVENYIDFGNPDQVRELRILLKEEDKQQQPLPAVKEEKENDKQSIDNDVLAKIKATLNPKFKTKLEKQVFVPEEIDRVVELITGRMNELGITTSETINIQYGKKFRFLLGLKQAETNIFYGKRGYSVVQSPRTGTNNELNELVAQIISEILL
jgi:hypothetical protein